VKRTILLLAILLSSCQSASDPTKAPTTHSYSVTCERTNYSTNGQTSVTWSTNTGRGGTITCTFAASGAPAPYIILQTDDRISVQVAGAGGYSEIMEHWPLGCTTDPIDGLPNSCNLPSTQAAIVYDPGSTTFMVP
jgi:hypothetical protein